MKRTFIPSYGTSMAAPSKEPASSGEKDKTFTLAPPTVPIDLSGFRVNEILPFIGQVFPSGGTEGGGRSVGWVVRKGVAVPALEDSYSPGGGLIYTYYTPSHPEWAGKVDLILRLVELAKTPASTPSTSPSPAPVSGPSTGTSTSSTTPPEWVWPTVIIGSGALVFYLLARKG